MKMIAPEFMKRIGDISRIEAMAKQVDPAEKEKKKGLFSRLFGS
jgi:hypothetical protein